MKEKQVVLRLKETGRTVFNRTRALWSPILLLESYLAATVFIFFFGPVDWSVPNSPKLLTFLLVNYGGLWVGYSWGIRRAKNVLSRPESHAGGGIKLHRSIKLLLLWSMVLTIFFTTLRLIAIRGGASEVVATLLNPGEAYRQAQEVAQMDRDRVQMIGIAPQYRWAFRISTVLAVFNGLYFPLGLICWRYLGPAYRLLFGLSLSCTIVFAMGVGAQSGIGFLFFSALPVVLYRLYVMGKPLTPAALNCRPRHVAASTRKLWVRSLAVGALCVLVLTVVYFQVDRQEASGRRAELREGLVGTFGLLSERSLVPFASERFNFGLAMLCFYVSHGYEGLALSMELPFEWTYGLGWSKALQVIYHDYVGGQDIFDRSYLARNEADTGWPALLWWSTIFPWIASDTTYFGTVSFMLLIGFVIARCWGDVILTGNPLGFAVLAQMFTLVFMFPANNALAQTLDGFFSLTELLILYALSRKVFTLKGASERAISGSIGRLTPSGNSDWFPRMEGV